MSATPETLSFAVVFATSEVPDQPATNLERNRPENSGGWTSDLRCCWPIEIGLRLFGQHIEPTRLRLTSHATFVPRLVEVYLGRSTEVVRDGQNTGALLKDASVLRTAWRKDYKAAMFTRLGVVEFLRPDDPSETFQNQPAEATSTHRRKRRKQRVELSIPSGTSSNFLRLIIHEPHRCVPPSANRYDQVGLRSVHVFGFPGGSKTPRWRIKGRAVDTTRSLSLKSNLGFSTTGNPSDPFATVSEAGLITPRSNKEQLARRDVFSRSQPPHSAISSKILDLPPSEVDPFAPEAELPMRSSSRFIGTNELAPEVLVGRTATLEGTAQGDSEWSHDSSNTLFSPGPHKFLTGALTMSISKPSLLTVGLGEFGQIPLNVVADVEDLSIEEEESCKGEGTLPPITSEHTIRPTPQLQPIVPPADVEESVVNKELEETHFVLTSLLEGQTRSGGDPRSDSAAVKEKWARMHRVELSLSPSGAGAADNQDKQRLEYSEVYNVILRTLVGSTALACLVHAPWRTRQSIFEALAVNISLLSVQHLLTILNASTRETRELNANSRNGTSSAEGDIIPRIMEVMVQKIEAAFAGPNDIQTDIEGDEGSAVIPDERQNDATVACIFETLAALATVGLADTSVGVVLSAIAFTRSLYVVPEGIADSTFPLRAVSQSLKVLLPTLLTRAVYVPPIEVVEEPSRKLIRQKMCEQCSSLLQTLLQSPRVGVALLSARVADVGGSLWQQQQQQQQQNRLGQNADNATSMRLCTAAFHGLRIILESHQTTIRHSCLSLDDLLASAMSALLVAQHEPSAGWDPIYSPRSALTRLSAPRLTGMLNEGWQGRQDHIQISIDLSRARSDLHAQSFQLLLDLYQLAETAGRKKVQDALRTKIRTGVRRHLPADHERLKEMVLEAFDELDQKRRPPTPEVETPDEGEVWIHTVSESFRVDDVINPALHQQYLETREAATSPRGAHYSGGDSGNGTSLSSHEQQEETIAMSTMTAAFKMKEVIVSQHQAASEAQTSGARDAAAFEGYDPGSKEGADDGTGSGEAGPIEEEDTTQAGEQIIGGEPAPTKESEISAAEETSDADAADEAVDSSPDGHAAAAQNTETESSAADGAGDEVDPKATKPKKKKSGCVVS